MSQEARPNFILVMTDQQRGDCLGIDGHPDLLTPNLDCLARSGARFTNAYSECPICIPARHALMTGKSPLTSGVTGFAMTARIADEENTLPNLMRLSGYQTASVGRDMHTYPHNKRYGFEIRNNDPFAQVYSKYHDIPALSNSSPAWKNWPHNQIHGASVNGFNARPWPFDEFYHETNHAINRAIEFLDNRDVESPFFLHVGTVAPHPPLIPPACYYDRYNKEGMRPPVVGSWVDGINSPLRNPPVQGNPKAIGSGRVRLEGGQLQSTLAGYYGLINHFDDQFQLLMSRLSTENLLENTYLIFTSDHGEMLGDHHCFRKAQPYEGSARIPFIMSGPDISSGTIVDQPIALMDILPTCCDLADIAIPQSIDGKSLVPAIKGKSLDRPYIYGTHSEMADCHGGFHFITDGRQKFIWWVEQGCEQFFDLESDPGECTDLSEDTAFKSQIDTMRSHLIELLQESPEGFVKDGKLVTGRHYHNHNCLATVD